MSIAKCFNSHHTQWYDTKLMKNARLSLHFPVISCKYSRYYACTCNCDSATSQLLNSKFLSIEMRVHNKGNMIPLMPNHLEP